MIPPDLGTYTVDERPMCVSNWELRRRDVGRPKWGQGGIPTQTTCAPTDNFAGIASDEMRPLQTLETEQGPVALPFGPNTSTGYMPTSVALQVAPFADSRRSGISDRYYK